MEKQQTFGEEDFYRLAKNIARNFYGVYSKHFILESMDVEDVVQEAYIAVLEIPKKTKNFTGYSLPLVKKAVSWKLRDLVRAIKSKYGEELEFIPLEVFTDGIEGCSDVEVGDVSSNGITKKADPLNNPKDLFRMFFNMKDIEQYLTKKQLLILTKRLEGNSTFEEISKELGYSQEYIVQTYGIAIKKLQEQYLDTKN